jgi:hypothetical protein
MQLAVKSTIYGFIFDRNKNLLCNLLLKILKFNEDQK